MESVEWKSVVSVYLVILISCIFSY